jgi:cytochrome P450/NADPH-cytochrome P450 reductase
MLGSEMIGTNDPAVAELFVKESEYFTKKIYGGLFEVKAFGGQGLFTTNSDDMDWKLAHKLLMPAFSPRAIKVTIQKWTQYYKPLISHLFRYLGISIGDELDWSNNHQVVGAIFSRRIC